MPSRKRYSQGGASSPAVPVNEERELIVVTTPSAGLRAAREALTSIAGADVDPLNAVLRESGATMVPVFGNEDRVARTLSESSAMFAMPQVPNLTSFYRVVADDEKLDDIARRLLETEVVESAFVKPPAFPPVIIDEDMAPPSPEPAPPATPSFNARQIYLDAAPAGIDARFAATVAGGKGQGVRIIDIEGAWRFSHEDLVQNQGGVIGGVPSGDIAWRDHGTAVIGEFGGDENTFGITGICPLANTRAISIFGANMGSARAITDAANALSPGDIILLELHRPGPRHNFQVRQDQLGYIAIEWWADDFAAVVFATSVRGVIVVEAAGNGAENLDDPIYNNRPAGFPVTWRNPFNLANPQSGAIIVGAGAPPPGTHGRNHGADRSRLGFSNFAARVDVQGWGREVTTSGYGDLQGGPSEDLWYTDIFSGTSSASPIIVGAVGCMQGALRAANKTLLTPATARNILRTTGSPQQDEPGRPATQRIGNRPNLRQTFGQLGLITKGKEIIKDVKNEKLERKELKDRIKEIVKEKPEIKDRKDKPETKEIIKDKDKEKDKEKEKDKDIKDIKDKEKEGKEIIKDLKDLAERFGGGFGPQMGGSPSGSVGDLESRVSSLEQTVGELTHFISGELRPDLQSSALSGEEDLVALSQQLQQQANDAKSAKDNKDIEKLRET
jgi:hypothetical protein